MALGAERFVVSAGIGSTAATTTFSLWTNDLGETVELEAAQFNQLDAIACSTSGYFTIGIYEYTAAGTQGDEVATIHFGTLSQSDDHVAFVAQDLTLDTTGLSLADGLSWAVVATKSGTASYLSRDALVTARFVKGMTSKA